MASRAELEARFPKLAGAEWVIKSPEDLRYNCVSWAARESHRRWWPAIYPPPGRNLDYWPPGVPRSETISAFVQAFATLGYEPCADGKYKLGYEKLAIYADEERTPTHMARQCLFRPGWLSKLGDFDDIFHRELYAVEGNKSPQSNEYGEVVQYLKRSWWKTLKYWMAGWKGPKA